MEFISLFFVIASVLVLGYLLFSYKAQKKLSMIWDIVFFSIYGMIFVVFIYPDILNVIENALGIQSAINFILYLSIFVMFFMIYFLYHKIEDQRIEITKLVREIAILKKDEKKQNKK